MEFVRNIRHQGARYDMATKLIIANVAVFLMVKFVSLFIYLFNIQIFDIQDFISIFAVPATLKKLLTHLWSPFTYMFLHQDFWHILGNMLWLFFLGRLFLMFIDAKKMFAVYILGGLSGAFFYILAFNIFPVFGTVKEVSIALGASASVTAVVMAICVYKPNFEIRLFGIFPLRLKWFIPIFILTDLISIPDGNAGGHIAHLGGAAYGIIFAIQLIRAKDITSSFNNFIDRIVSFFATKRKPVMKVTFNAKKSNFVNNTGVSNKVQKPNEVTRTNVEDNAEMDRILDKISKTGYNSLTQTEKDFLMTFSNKD